MEYEEDGIDDNAHTVIIQTNTLCANSVLMDN